MQNAHYFFAEVAISASAFIFSGMLLGSNNALDYCNVAIKDILNKNIAARTITVTMVFYSILLWAFEISNYI